MRWFLILAVAAGCGTYIGLFEDRELPQQLCYISSELTLLYGYSSCDRDVTANCTLQEDENGFIHIETSATASTPTGNCEGMGMQGTVNCRGISRRLREDDVVIYRNQHASVLDIASSDCNLH